jgi:Mlc titration factor MtfA (ptsG expression regulator)
MVCGFFKNRRRRKILAEAFPESWESVIRQSVPYVGALSEAERAKCRDVVQVMMAEKTFEGCGGFEVTDEVRLTVLAQAALLIVHLDHDYYRRVKSILVYPSGFMVPGEGGSEAQVLGLAAYGGPVVLSWNSVQGGAANVQDGHNLVFHEFAHKLDMLDGMADGTPPLGRSVAMGDWVRIMTDEYEALCGLTSKRRRGVLRKYGATNAAEFFAVATECYFEKPRQMKKKHSELYGLLKDYYGYDTAGWGL